jgi:hypothetical protein
LTRQAPRVDRLPNTPARPSLALFGTFHPWHRRPTAGIGFVPPNCPADPTRAAPDWVCLDNGPRHRRANWLCLYSGPRPAPPGVVRANWLCLFTATPLLAVGHAKLGLFVQLSPAPPGELALFVRPPGAGPRRQPQAGGSCGNSPLNPQSDNSAEGGRRLPGAVPEIRTSSAARPRLSSFRFRVINHNSSIINHTVPLSRGRVARIVTEFCARTTPETGATPCTQTNNEFFARGVFYLFNRCTNVDSQTVDGQRKHCYPAEAGTCRPPRRRGVGNRTSMTVADSGGTRTKPGCVPCCPGVRPCRLVPPPSSGLCPPFSVLAPRCRLSPDLPFFTCVPCTHLAQSWAEKHP